MLTQATMTTMLPVKNFPRALDFYLNKLGLAPIGPQLDGKFLLRCGGGGEIGLVPRHEGTKAEHTAAGFRVDDIGAEIRELKARGVKFYDYDLPGLKTVDHVCVYGAEKAAWFGDSEGNILCLHEPLAKHGH